MKPSAMAKQGIHVAEILTVGTELLMGQILNRNALYLAEQLRDLGISSYYQTTCGDNRERLSATLRQAIERSDCVLITGGLGPTQDDLTMEVVAQETGLTLELDRVALAEIEAYYQRSGRPMPPNNQKQAMLPREGEILINRNGTAPGTMVSVRKQSQDGLCLLVVLPGPPNENQLMFQEQVTAVLAELSPHRFRNSYLKLVGIGESNAELLIQDFIEQQSNPSIAPYCSPGEVKFRVTQRYQDESEPDLCTPLIEQLHERLKPYVYEIGHRTLDEVVRDLLLSQGKTLALAESCTGGYLSNLLCQKDGASSFFLGSVVSYANSAKANLLGVETSTLETEGAVSEACALEMAKGARKAFGSDIALSITGIAGPSGGSVEKPVGTVYIALETARQKLVKKFHFQGTRSKCQQLAAVQALNLIRLALLEETKLADDGKGRTAGMA